MALGGREPAALGVPARDVPFDADLGRGPRGQLLAVYSRCDSEPNFRYDDLQGSLDWTGGKSCDLYEYDFSTSRERRLPLSSRASEVWPTVDGRHVAFVRSGRLYIGSGTRSRRLPSGGRGTPVGLDLRGRSLAFGWTYSGSGDSLGPASDIRVVDVRTRKVRRVDSYSGGGLTTIGRGAPSWEGSRLYWARLCQGDPAGCGGRTGLMRTGPRGPQRAKLRADDTWQARGDGVTYILRDTDQWHGCFDPEISPDKATCTIVATTPRYR